MRFMFLYVTQKIRLHQNFLQEFLDFLERLLIKKTSGGTLKETIVKIPEEHLKKVSAETPDGFFLDTPIEIHEKETLYNTHPRVSLSNFWRNFGDLLDKLKEKPNLKEFLGEFLEEPPEELLQNF